MPLHQQWHSALPKNNAVSGGGDDHAVSGGGERRGRHAVSSSSQQEPPPTDQRRTSALNNDDDPTTEMVDGDINVLQGTGGLMWAPAPAVLQGKASEVRTDLERAILVLARHGVLVELTRTLFPETFELVGCDAMKVELAEKRLCVYSM